ncbi:MAG TPA: carboxypeptidase-like regulatory domain-containing protein, partial [Candidatus Baltobacteraceae bacterium]|nr:carboxypeptidase-like regulatory domain-containing protein [Candidatus Baltobacteraceae bacterium]
MKRHATWRSLMVLAMIATFVTGQVTWALAGTTGGVGGTVTDASGAPVAGASVSFASPSENATGTTDAGGHFSFLSLAPDTYTVSIQKAG